MKASNAASASLFVSAIQISCNDRLAFGCWLFGSLLRTLADGAAPLRLWSVAFGRCADGRLIGRGGNPRRKVDIDETTTETAPSQQSAVEEVNSPRSRR